MKLSLKLTCASQLAKASDPISTISSSHSSDDMIEKTTGTEQVPRSNFAAAFFLKIIWDVAAFALMGFISTRVRPILLACLSCMRLV